jgi:predicted lipid-binding transport protein (Tim44 family)
MLRFRQLLALLAVASVLSLAAVPGADARPGSGSSLGSRGSRSFSTPMATPTAPNPAAPLDRSMAQPSRPGLGSPAGGGFFGRPGFFGGGFFGGMLTGFLGAGLIGMLFGHGLFGGLGGFASILGLLLQVALVVIVARFAWAWWQRRNTPAYAGPMARLAQNDPYGGSYGGSGLGAAPSGMQSTITIGKDDFDAFERLLGEVEGAYGREDLAALRGYATPEVLSYLAEDLAKNASRGVVNHISDVKLLQGDLAEAWREGDVDYATVAMRFSLVDVTVERSSGKVVEGDEQPTQVTELWTFMRSRGGGWLLSAIQQTR